MARSSLSVEVAPGLHLLRLGSVNAYVLEIEGGLALVDTGTPGAESGILAAVGRLGHSPEDVRHIVVTHLHPDHAGGLAALQAVCRAETWMHEADAELVRRGSAARPMKPAPGLLNRALFRAFIRDEAAIAPAVVNRGLDDRIELPFAAARVLHTPGHTRGHVSLVVETGRGAVLLAADAVSNMLGLGWSIAYEDLAAGRRSAQRLAGHETAGASIVCFGHGKPVSRERYVGRFASEETAPPTSA